MLILGIESSCDETGVALYDTDKGLIADALHTQIEMVKKVLSLRFRPGLANA